jgi:hypothetical protein
MYKDLIDQWHWRHNYTEAKSRLESRTLKLMHVSCQGPSEDMQMENDVQKCMISSTRKVVISKLSRWTNSTHHHDIGQQKAHQAWNGSSPIDCGGTSIIWRIYVPLVTLVTQSTGSRELFNRTLQQVGIGHVM